MAQHDLLRVLQKALLNVVVIKYFPEMTTVTSSYKIPNTGARLRNALQNRLELSRIQYTMGRNDTQL